MKIRNSFVSNSSSSSFVFIADKEKFDKVMENIHPYYKQMLRHVEPKKMFGKDVVFNVGVECSDSEPDIYDYEGEVLGEDGKVLKTIQCGDEWDYSSDDYPMCGTTAMKKVKKEIEKADGDVIFEEGDG